MDLQLDRRTPARRDACTTAQTGIQTWRDLLFVHWEVPVEALRGLVPAPLSIDLFEGRAYVGLVPFTMHDVRIGPVRVRDFLETNLRTYVHAEGVPGVWFFSLDAQSPLAVWGGRTMYRLPYFTAQMKCLSRPDSCDYRLRRRVTPAAALDVAWTALEHEAHNADEGTLEHFLTERYALYGSKRPGSAYRLRVHHARWPLRRARLDLLSTSIPAAVGLNVRQPIELVLASCEGVSVQIFATERVGCP
jgi:uncharacterized protein YqjF (DUF2071 family)